ncbi:MAG TPA: DUF3466 family protein [Humisphaera sp.]
MGFVSFLAGRLDRPAFVSRRRPAAPRHRVAAAARRAAADAFRAIESLEARTLFATYNVVDLGVVIDDNIDTAAINNTGQVAVDTKGTDYRGQKWVNGTLTEVSALPGFNESYVTGINASGVVVGHSNSSAAAQFRAFTWDGSTTTPIPNLPGANSETAYTNAYAINDAGVVVGVAQAAPVDPQDGVERGFVYENGTITDIGTLAGAASPGAASGAYAINASGQVAGYSETASGVQHAVLRTGTTLADLGTLSTSSSGDDRSVAYGINDAGFVVGLTTTGTTSTPPTRAFLYNGTTMTSLGALAGDNYSEARDVNNGGAVVGFSADNSDQDNPRAFLYTGGTLTDLNGEIDAGSGWTLTKATSINDVGQIVGVGILNGQQRAFLLTPTGGVGDQTPPAGTVTVTPPVLGGATLTVSVTYTDDDAVNVGSVDVNDVRVTRDGDSTPLTVTGVTKSSNVNAASVTATYTLAAPGGTWDGADDGTYTAALRSSQVSDATGNFAAATNAQFAVNFSATSGPSVSIAPIASVTTAGGTSGTVVVTYADTNGVSVASIGVDDLTIVGGGTSIAPATVTTNPGTDANSVVATYTFAPPGGSWNSDDNDAYTVSLGANQVADTLGNFAPAASTTFTVDIPVVVPTLDPAFNAANPVNNGFVAEGVVTDLDGRLYVAGHAGTVADGTSVGILRRYNADGSLDATFGTGGQVQTAAGLNDAYYNVALDPTGKLVVVSGSRGTDFLAARYSTKNGKLDTKFGTKGAALTDLGGDAEAAYALAVGPDQKVYLAGPTANAVAFLRLDKKGKADTTFGLGGNQLVNVASRGVVSKIVLQPNGFVVAAGDLDGTVFVTRLGSDGAIDPGFGNGAAVDVGQLATRTDLGGADRTIGLALQADGKILVANRTSTGDFGVVRLDTTGAADATFSGDGLATVDMGGSDDDADQVLVQGTGQIVLVGTTNAGGSQTAVAVLAADGTPVPSFDGDGKYAVATSVADPATALVVGGQPVFAAAAIQPNGKLVTATSSLSPTSGSGLRRLNVPGSGQLGQFGVVNGKKTSLAFTDADGTKVTLSLKSGTATAYYDGTNVDVTVAGSTTASSIGVKTKGGDGRVRFGDVRTDGALGGFSAKTGDVFGTFYVNGELKKVEVGTLTGSLVASGSIGSATFRGDLAGAQVLAGTNVGADGEIGGGDDAVAAALIGKLSVSGSVAASVVGAGFDPIDGDLFNGGQVIGGPASVIKSIAVKVATDGASRFFAGTFGKIKAPEKVVGGFDPRFVVL